MYTILNMMKFNLCKHRSRLFVILVSSLFIMNINPAQADDSGRMILSCDSGMSRKEIKVFYGESGKVPANNGPLLYIKGKMPYSDGKFERVAEITGSEFNKVTFKAQGDGFNSIEYMYGSLSYIGVAAPINFVVFRVEGDAGLYFQDHVEAKVGQEGKIYMKDGYKFKPMRCNYDDMLTDQEVTKLQNSQNDRLTVKLISKFGWRDGEPQIHRNYFLCELHGGVQCRRAEAELFEYKNESR